MQPRISLFHSQRIRGMDSGNIFELVKPKFEVVPKESYIASLALIAGVC